MRMILGRAKESRTIVQVRAGFAIEFVDFESDATYVLRAGGEVVDVNPGNLMELKNATLSAGQLGGETCYARYMPEEGTVIVRIE